jgi:hypothetical protein
MPTQEIDFISPFSLEECLARVPVHSFIERADNGYILHGDKLSFGNRQPILNFKLQLQPVGNQTHITGHVQQPLIVLLWLITVIAAGVVAGLAFPVPIVVVVLLVGWVSFGLLLTVYQSRKFMSFIFATFQPVKKRIVARSRFRHFALPFMRFRYPLKLSFDACTGRIQGLVFTRSYVHIWEVDDATREFVITSSNGCKIIGVIERDNETSYVNYGFGLGLAYYLMVGFAFFLGGYTFPGSFNIATGLSNALFAPLFFGTFFLIDGYFFHRRIRRFLNSPLKKIEWRESKSKRKVG